MSGERLSCDKYDDYYPLLPPMEDSSPVRRESYLSQYKFTESLRSLGHEVPEIDENYELIADAGRRLIEHNQIEAELFDDPAQSLIFASIASRYAKMDESKIGPEKEMVLLENCLMFLAANCSGIFEEKSDQDKPESETLSTEYRVAVYNQFTDWPHTKALREALDNGLLDELKTGLNIKDKVPYELRVLSIGNDGHTFGLEAPLYNKKTLTREDLQHFKDLQTDVQNWCADLKRRTKEFAKLMAWPDIPQAWVDDFADSETPEMLCIMLPVAEKLLDPSLTDNDQYYAQTNGRQYDLATLGHEFKHTQSSLMTTGFFGLNLEEYSAELFANGQNSYNNIKTFFADYKIVTGHDMGQEILSRPLGGKPEEVYASIANAVGLDSMLEVLSALPSHYLESGLFGESAKDIFRVIGEYNGVIQRLMQKFEKEPGYGERFAKAAQDIANDNEYHVVVDALHKRRQYGSHCVVDILENLIFQNKHLRVAESEKVLLKMIGSPNNRPKST